MSGYDPHHLAPSIINDLDTSNFLDLPQSSLETETATAISQLRDKIDDTVDLFNETSTDPQRLRAYVSSSNIDYEPRQEAGGLPYPCKIGIKQELTDVEDDGRDEHSAEDDERVFEEEVTTNLGQRLESTMPFDDGSIAFGTILVFEHDYGLGLRTYIKGLDQPEEYPHILIKTGLAKKWIRLDGLSIGTRNGVTSLRVYILPEDIDRSNRGNVKDFRKMVRYLLKLTDCTTAAWTGQTDLSTELKIYREPMEATLESLFYIFNTLKSPTPDLSSYNGDTPGLQAMSDALGDCIQGVRTPLYSYQKRSIAAMIKKEADPAKIRDLRKNKFQDMYGNTFYLDIYTGSLLRHRTLYYEPKGGILAETMGYGKTLICLALIMATRGHYPAIPHYCIGKALTKTYSHTPSLLSIAARRLRYEGLPWKSEFYSLKKTGYHFDRCVEELQQYERSYDEPVRGTLNPSRRGKVEYSNTVHLCSATLVIVPPNLIIQWQQEVKRHIDDDAIDLLVVDTIDTIVPPWRELVKYDIVLISKARFEQEYRDDDLNQGRGNPYVDKYKSPLTEVRWLRVICDEGHGFAGSSTKTNAMAMLDKMFIECRWVVSGTPSSTLHGVEVSLASISTDDIDMKPSRKESFVSSLEQRISPQTRKAEDKDLERLRLMVVNFLKLQPWSNKKGDDQADFKFYLGPRSNIDGSRSSRPSLREVMQTLIIRHRIQDIDCDLMLPPLHNSVTYLKPSYYDALSINLFVMILTANYVTSEREDEDYMFHPRNRGTLTTLINNLGHATFYWVGITEQNVADTLGNAQRYFEKNLDKMTDEDALLLTEGTLVAQKALEDPKWLAFSRLHEMGTYLAGFPQDAKASWALDGKSSEPLLMGTTQSREVQKHFETTNEKHGSNPISHLSNHGRKIMTAARSRAEEESKRRGKQNAAAEIGESGTFESAKRAPTIASSPASRQREQPRSSRTMAAPHGREDVNVADILWPDTNVIGFASAKLTYLCNKLLSHPDDKTIIFYNHNNTAWFFAEALELLRIPFLIYANTLSVRQRAEYLAKFNSDAEMKVLLMDLKQAGQGLHVAAASRVYIISPIWDPALESQAIKRAHRIGQTKEVFVETLVLKDTFEEILVRRRKEKAAEDGRNRSDAGVKSDSTETPKKSRGPTTNPLLEDRVMVKVLKDIKFLRMENEEDKVVHLVKPVPLLKISSPASYYGPSSSTQGTVSDSVSLDGSKNSPHSNAEQEDDESAQRPIFGYKMQEQSGDKRNRVQFELLMEASGSSSKRPRHYGGYRLGRPGPQRGG